MKDKKKNARVEKVFLLVLVGVLVVVSGVLLFMILSGSDALAMESRTSEPAKAASQTAEAPKEETAAPETTLQSDSEEETQQEAARTEETELQQDQVVEPLEVVTAEEVEDSDFGIFEEESEEEEESSAPPEPFIVKALGKVSRDYFDDALFIGDSRTVGLQEFGGLENAAYFAESGIGNSGLYYDYIYVDGYGTYDLEGLLQEYKFGKIYIASGVNGIGAGAESTFEDFMKIVDLVRQYQPDALLYIQANIKVTYDFAYGNYNCNNELLKEYNDLLATLDDGETTFYLDVSKPFETTNGDLADEKSYDGLHLYPEAYAEWGQFLLNHALVEVEVYPQ